jgi:hypothetical protein
MYGILLTRSSWIPFPMCSLAFSLASVRCTLLSAPRQNLDVIALNYSRSFGLSIKKLLDLFMSKKSGRRRKEKDEEDQMRWRTEERGREREDEETLKKKDRRWEKGEMRSKEEMRGEKRRKEKRRGEKRRKEEKERKDEDEGDQEREEEEKRGK